MLPFVSVAAASFMRATLGQALPPAICITASRIVRGEYWVRICDRKDDEPAMCEAHSWFFRAGEKSHNSKTNGCTPTFVVWKEDAIYKHSK